MNKVLIKKRFEKSLSTYNDNAIIQKQMADNLLSLENKTKFENILEIGCGSGILTQKAIQKFEFENYTANDIVSSCSKYIKEISPKIQFVSGDIESIIKTEKKYDLIISNAVFQWIEDSDSFFKNIINCLNHNGTLLFSTFGENNFIEIKKLHCETLDYKSLDYYRTIFNKYPLSIKEQNIIQNFDSAKDVLKHIKLTGVNAISEKMWTISKLREFENKYQHLCNQQITLTYNPLYIKVENRIIG